MNLDRTTTPSYHGLAAVLVMALEIGRQAKMVLEIVRIRKRK
jgi:hypothetical protein